MRPPHCAGEIWENMRFDKKGTRASMRPPHCAGEIHPAHRQHAVGQARFNEAPALRGGNQPERLAHHLPSKGLQ